MSQTNTPPQDSSASNSPVNQELDQSYVSPSVRKLMRNSNQENTHFFVKIKIARIFAAIPGQTLIFLGIHGIEIQIPSTTTQERTSWVVTCRGKNHYVDELHLNDPDDSPTSSELLLERSVAKESLVLQRWSNLASRETHATQLEIQPNPVYNYSEEVIPIEERKWNDIPAYKHFRGTTVQAEVSQLVMRLVRHYDQNEGETDGAVHWNSMGPKLRKAFQKARGPTFSYSDLLQYI